ncbi:DcuS/MalK family sensor histidine kinase [Alteribacillus bidgolensis]|uniref:histidine kinase n=1 Tax=Alteribacillus bidgolensis TaxID=930129 RepID=A0A1G8HJD3_9BACI|nr:DcuS/MalK family sensor histidine kinase [Alteribacillus bidgolensis]SDI06621.1 two-component system, CitB family, sensor histidine kinase MalK [Alteribacillus bidgolensis]
MKGFFHKHKTLKLQTWITLLVCLVIIVALSVTGLLIGRDTSEKARETLEDKTMNIANTVSRAPAVIEGLADGEPSKTIQSYTLDVQANTNVEYIVVMDMHHIRQSHPVEERIGQYFVGGDEDRAFRGERYTSVAEGTLGESLRSFVPIWNENGEQIGVVSVGILLDNVESVVMKQQRMVYLGTGAGMLAGIIGAVLLARRVKRTLHGLEPNEIAQLLQEREAMLASVREGIVAIDDTGTIVVANDAAKELFRKTGLIKNPIGQDAESFLNSSSLKQVLTHQKAEFDQEHILNGVVLVESRVPVIINDQVVGALATFRDKSELASLVEQLTGAKHYAETLREKTHEFMNKLHVMSAMVHTESYQELKDYIKQISKAYQQEVGSVSRVVKDPVLAGFLLNKLNHFQERGTKVKINGNFPLPILKDTEKIDALITIIGNLSDNAYEAIAGQEDKRIEMTINYIDGYFHFMIKDNGPGISETDRDHIFSKGRSTKGENRGLGMYLINKALQELNGTITVRTEEEQGTIFKVKIPYEGEKA